MGCSGESADCESGLLGVDDLVCVVTTSLVGAMVTARTTVPLESGVPILVGVGDVGTATAGLLGVVEDL